jgi:hypothetical protein
MAKRGIKSEESGIIGVLILLFILVISAIFYAFVRVKGAGG